MSHPDFAVWERELAEDRMQPACLAEALGSLGELLPRGSWDAGFSFSLASQPERGWTRRQRRTAEIVLRRHRALLADAGIDVSGLGMDDYERALARSGGVVHLVEPESTRALCGIVARLEAPEQAWLASCQRCSFIAYRESSCPA